MHSYKQHLGNQILFNVIVGVILLGFFVRAWNDNTHEEEQMELLKDLSKRLAVVTKQQAVLSARLPQPPGSADVEQQRRRAAVLNDFLEKMMKDQTEQRKKSAPPP